MCCVVVRSSVLLYVWFSGTISELLCTIVEKQQHLQQQQQAQGCRLAPRLLKRLLSCIDLLLPAQDCQLGLSRCGAAADMTRGQARSRVVDDNCANLPQVSTASRARLCAHLCAAVRSKLCASCCRRPEAPCCKCLAAANN